MTLRVPPSQQTSQRIAELFAGGVGQERDVKSAFIQLAVRKVIGPR